MTDTTSPLTVTVLGASGSFPGPDGACTGFLVQSAGANVWLDAGPGTFVNLQRHIDVKDLTAIVVTHEHGDHWLSLPLVAVALRHYFEFDRAVPVYGTAGTRRLVELMCAATPDTFEWHDTADGDTVTIADQAWRFLRTHHYVETLACEVDVGGKTFVFTADTGPDWEPAAFGVEPDLLISESTFLSVAEILGIQHLSARQAGAAAAAAGAKRLVLSHLAPGQSKRLHRNEAARAYGDVVTVAKIGDRYPV